MKQFERKIITFVFRGKMVSQRILLTCSPWNATCTPVTCLEGQILIVYFIAVNLGLHYSCKSNVPPLTDISVRYRELLDICSMPWSIFFFKYICEMNFTSLEVNPWQSNCCPLLFFSAFSLPQILLSLPDVSFPCRDLRLTISIRVVAGRHVTVWLRWALVPTRQNHGVDESVCSVKPPSTVRSFNWVSFQLLEQLPCPVTKPNGCFCIC